VCVCVFVCVCVRARVCACVRVNICICKHTAHSTDLGFFLLGGDCLKVGGVLRGGGRYLKMCSTGIKNPTKSLLKVKRLEDEVVSLRQQLEMV